MTVADEDIEGDGDAYEVWPENWPSVSAFLACGTQWRVAVGMSAMMWLGLDYAGVDVVLRRAKAKAGVFDDLRVMEMEALRTFDEVEK